MCYGLNISIGCSMASVVQNPYKQDQYAIIHFLMAEACKPVMIHWRTVTVYRENRMSKRTVTDWLLMFRDDH